MTIFSSKKPSNSSSNAKDLSSSSTNAQQQPQSSSSASLTVSRQRLSRDDETTSNAIANSAGSLIEDSNLACESNLASSSSTGNSNMLTTTAPVSFPNSKRKSHHQHHHPTTVKQARRRRGSVGEKVTSNAASVANVTGNSPATSLTIDNSLPSSSNPNEHAVTRASTSLADSSSTTAGTQDEPGQCNSEDEYEQTTVKYDRNNLNELEMRFARALKEKKGFVIKPIKEDGACLFRAVSDQVFGDEEMHTTVRQNCMDYIVKNADFFRSYITEDFDHYISRKRRQNCHGNHIEMIALSELYNRPIEVYEYSIEPINVVHGMYKTDNEPIRLSYHCGVHYNSISDPWRPTAGHGLGLPDLEPGRAQESLIRTALRQSEESHLERAMLDDKIAATDWEATQDELIQQVARESYLQWLCDANQQHKDNKTMPSSSASPTSSTTSERASNVTHASSPRNLLPLRLDERKDCEFALPFHYGGGDVRSTADLVDEDEDDDDDSLMRQVLAISQIEYVEALKKHRQPSNSDDPTGPSSSSDAHLL